MTLFMSVFTWRQAHCQYTPVLSWWIIVPEIKVSQSKAFFISFAFPGLFFTLQLRKILRQQEGSNEEGHAFNILQHAAAAAAGNEDATVCNVFTWPQYIKILASLRCLFLHFLLGFYATI